MVRCDRCGSSTEKIRCIVDVLDVNFGASARKHYALCEKCKGDLKGWLGVGE